MSSLFALSFGLSRWAPSFLHNICPLGRDPLRPDQSVCELSLGGLWVSMAIAFLAALVATGFGLFLALLARRVGGVVEQGVVRASEAFFALPDVLVLMVFQLAGQTLGELNPSLRLSPLVLMVLSLGLLGWAAPAWVLHSRLETLERQDFVTAAKALGATRAHILRYHLWPALKSTLLTLFLARVPAAILAESTVSFLGIGRVEPMSLGRYLGTSYSAVLYEGGWRIVGPAWALLVLVVWGAVQAGSGQTGERPTFR